MRRNIELVAMLVLVIIAFILVANIVEDADRREAYNAYMSGFWMADFAEVLDIPEAEAVYVYQDLDDTGTFLVFGNDSSSYGTTEMPISALAHMAYQGLYEADIQFICQDDLPIEKCKAIASGVYCYVANYTEDNRARITCTP